MENEIIVGLDIGTTKIACFVGMRGESGKVKILGFGKTDSKGVEHGVVKSVTETADSIRRAVAEAADQADVDIDEVYVGIAGQHIKSRPSHGSVMIPSDHRLIEQEDVDRLIAEQYNTLLEPGEEIIHIFPQQYIVDREPLSREIYPVGVVGKTLEANFHMVTANVQNLQYIKYAVQDAGLKIKDVVLEPVASAKAVLDDSDRDAGVAMVDIGGGTTDIAIFHDGIIRHTSVLPLAGNAITNDIREGCNILKKQAESLKVKFGSCLVQAVSENDVISIPGIRSQAPREIYVKTLAGIINARTKMILEQVDYEIKLSGFDKKLIAGVTLTGGGAQLKNIKELCELITTTDTRIGIPNEHLEPDSVSFAELAHPMYATGIGLVLFGIEQSESEHTEEPEEEATPVDNSRVDIFADMGVEPSEDPTPASQDIPEKPAKKEKSKEKKGNFEKKISRFIRDVFNESIDD
ncbi:MAG: cell division protein FtsA [Bacteroidales bacterium]|nr:cell division protein FtsA [Bacteroidales bacterium]